MKKWKEFIEEVVPSEQDRDFLKMWVKNVALDRLNQHELCLYGEGATGKTTLLKTIEEILKLKGKTCGSITNRNFRVLLKSTPNLIIFDDYIDYKSSGLAKHIIEDISSNVIVLLNKHSDVIFRRCHTIIMGSVNNQNPRMLQELLSDIDSIKSYFFD